MMIYPDVVEVRPLENYCLEIRFEDGKGGRLDCSELLDFGVFKELANEAYFHQVKIAGGTVAWPNGQDIAPETVYMKAVEGATWPLV